MLKERNPALPISLPSDWGGQGDEVPDSGRPSIDLHGADGRLLRTILTGLDLVAVVATWLTAVLLRPHPHPQLLAAAAVAAATTLLGLRAAGLYQARVCAVRSCEAVRATLAALCGAGVFAGLVKVVGENTSLPVLVVALEVATAVVVLRWCFARWLKARHSAGRSLRTIVLVGANEDAVDLWTTLSSEPELGYRVGAVVGTERADAQWTGLPTGSVSDLASVARQVGANGVILVGSALGTKGREALTRAFQAGLHVQVWAGLPVDSRRLRMTPTFGVPLFYIEPHRSPAEVSWSRHAKRTMDILGALVLGVVTAPVLAVAALLIKLEDGGSVLYRAERIGQFGLPITVFKLRTMVPNAAQLLDQVALLNERTDGPLFKAESDPRVTRIGRLLRASSIDELPQLWNVLNGSMSLVGPRPALPAEVERFDDELRRRHEVRPGITGPWQIEARDNPSFNAYRRYDLAYVDSWSLWWDLSILCSTLHTVIARGMRPLLRLVLPRGR